MKVSDLLFIAEKIDYGIRDSETTARHFDPLWKNPILLEALINMLKAYESNDHMLEFQKGNFTIIKNLICPDYTVQFDSAD